MQTIRTALTTLVTIICLGFVASVGLLGYDTDTRRAFVPKTPGVESVYHDEGGSIDAYVNKYAKWLDEGKYLRIDGVCVSACTYFLKRWPLERVCATPLAIFGFHGTYNPTFDPEWTPWYHHEVAYPDYVNKLLLDRGFDGTKDVDEKTYPLGVIWLTRDDLRLQHCPQ